MPGFNAPVMHRHSALSCFVARAMPSVPPAVAGNSGPDDLGRKPMCARIQWPGCTGMGVLWPGQCPQYRLLWREIPGPGGSRMIWAENLCVAGFNPPVMHRHSALSCFVARAMPSVPPAVAGNSGPRGLVGGGGSRMICWPKTYVCPDSMRR